MVAPVLLLEPALVPAATQGLSAADVSLNSNAASISNKYNL